MLDRLIPKNENFFICFSDAAENILKGSKLLQEMIASGTASEEGRIKVKNIEHVGDKITHDTVLMLNKTFITPIDREDIYALICALDDVMDFLDSVADKYALYKLGSPTPQVLKLADIIVRAADEAVRGVAHLKKLDASVNRSCIELNSLENEADRVSRDAIAELFETEKDPIQLIKWKEIYETFENAADRFEDVANILEGIVLKHA
ncbi:MAG: DUF47 family protein [Deltaproteobacteria bacterium]|nr:DUF47 family protein [Deltaproteobacteria bacterium]